MIEIVGARNSGKGTFLSVRNRNEEMYKYQSGNKRDLELGLWLNNIVEEIPMDGIAKLRQNGKLYIKTIGVGGGLKNGK